MFLLFTSDLGWSRAYGFIGSMREREPRITDDYRNRVMRQDVITIDTPRRTVTRTGTAISDKVHVPISLCLFILIVYVSIEDLLSANKESGKLENGIRCGPKKLSAIDSSDLTTSRKHDIRCS